MESASSGKDNGSPAPSAGSPPAAGGREKAVPGPGGKDRQQDGGGKGAEASSPPRSSADGSSTRERRLNFLNIRVSIAGGIATILTLVVAIIALVVQLQPGPSGSTQAGTGRTIPADSHDPAATAVPPASSPPRLTAEAVKGALLTSAELAAIDSSLKASDIQAPGASSPLSASCDDGTTYPADAPSRLFEDGSTLAIVEQINEFRSDKAAEGAFGIDSKTLTCGLQSADNISDEVNGLCDQSYAAEAAETRAGFYPAALYAGVIRCGRLVVFVMLETPDDAAFDQTGKFAILAEIAVPKVEALPGG